MYPQARSQRLEVAGGWVRRSTLHGARMDANTRQVLGGQGDIRDHVSTPFYSRGAADIR